MAATGLEPRWMGRDGIARRDKAARLCCSDLGRKRGGPRGTPRHSAVSAPVSPLAWARGACGAAKRNVGRGGGWARGASSHIALPDWLSGDVLYMAVKMSLQHLH
jgi:hypothetical protein